jgi:hypothetical protein
LRLRARFVDDSQSARISSLRGASYTESSSSVNEEGWFSGPEPSSGRPSTRVRVARGARWRLDRAGSRQINAAIHRMAVTRARCDPQTRDYIARKKAEGKTNRDAIRCLKRHFARRIWQLLRAQPPPPSTR